MITIIGRGHGGTRAISQTLSASGVFMGHPLNRSGDLLPPEAMYEACRVLAPYMTWQGDLSWDFDEVLAADIPQRFRDLITEYLGVVLASPAPRKGWKIPETTLVYPWIARMFPDARYIIWTRDPRDSILRPHLTDDLPRFGVEVPPTEDKRRQRAISWLYQYELIQATPRPQHCIEVRFEDFVLDQEATLARLEDFLGFELARIPVRPEAVGRWQSDDGVHYFDFLKPAMEHYGYGGNK